MHNGETAFECSLRVAVYAMCAARLHSKSLGLPLTWVQSIRGPWADYWERNWASLRPLLQAQPWIADQRCDEQAHCGPFTSVFDASSERPLPLRFLDCLGPGLDDCPHQPWISAPDRPVSSTVFVSWKELPGGRRYESFPWLPVIRQLESDGLRVEWVGPIDRYCEFRRMTGSDLAIRWYDDLLDLAGLMKSARGYVGSPGLYHAVAAGLGKRRVLVSKPDSCEHWGAIESRLMQRDEGAARLLLAA